MSSSQLRLEILLNAVDKVTAPLKDIMSGSTATAKALKESRDQVKALEKAQSQLASHKELSQQAIKTAAALETQQLKVRALKEQINAVGVPTKKLASEFNKAQKETGKLTTTHEAQRQKLTALAQALHTAGVGAGSYAKKEFSLRTRLDETTKQLQRQQTELAKTAQLHRRVSEINGAGKAIKSAGMTTAMHGAGAAYGALSAGRGTLNFMQEGMDFDATMSRVQALTRQEKDSTALAALREQARKLGAETAFSATDAAQGQAFLAMAGFTPDSIMAAMPGLLDAARAGGTELARTADIASNILSGMKIDPSQMGKVADVLVATFTRSNTSLETLGESMKYTAPVAAQYQQSLETVAAVTGKLGDAGIQGGQAGTAMRAIFSRLASPPAAAAKAIEALGLRTKDAKGNMLALPEILDQINKKTKAMGNTDSGALLKAIAGEEAASALAVMLNEAGNGSLGKLITELQGAQGEAAKVAKTMGDNLVGDIDELSSAFSELKISLFDGQNGALRTTVKELTELVAAVGVWMAKNKEAVAVYAKWAAIAVAVLGVLGVLAFTLGTLATVLGAVVSGFSLIYKALGLLKIALAANPLLLALLLMATAVAMIYHNWEPIAEFFSGLWARISTSSRAVWDDLVSFFSGLWQQITGFFSSGISNIAQTFLNFSPLALLYSALIAGLEALGFDIPEKFKTLGAAIVDGLIGGFLGNLGALKDAIVGGAGAVTDWFKEKLGIHSPSRVFAELGVNTLEGYQQGLENEENSTLKRVGSLTKNITTASEGILTDGMVGIANFDTRPAISPTGYSNAIAGGDTYHFYITPPAGTDPQAIANEIERILRQRDAEKARRGRSTLSDRYSF